MNDLESLGDRYVLDIVKQWLRALPAAAQIYRATAPQVMPEGVRETIIVLVDGHCAGTIEIRDFWPKVALHRYELRSGEGCA